MGTGKKAAQSIDNYLKTEAPHITQQKPLLAKATI
jgi:hypothetical protein